MEQDKPSAGTPCCICKSKGHFCPAETYADSDEAVCLACLHRKPCSVDLAKTPAMDSLGEEFQIPYPPHKTMADETEKRRMNLCGMFIDCKDHIESLGIYDLNRLWDASLKASVPSWFVVRDGLMLLDEPIFYDKREVARDLAQDLSKGDCEEVKLMVFRRQNGQVCRGRPPGSGRKAGETYKNEQREQAAKLLLEGYSTRKAAEKTGLSKNTIAEVRKATPGAPPKANSGGAPQHKKNTLTRTTGIEATNLSLSRAFELVAREMRTNAEALEEIKDMEPGDETLSASIELHNEAIKLMSDYHPAVTGIPEERPTIYDRALDSIEREMFIIDMEIKRLSDRREALDPICKALKDNISKERETR